MSNRLIIGCGYLGKRVAKKWQALGHQVHVLTRNEKTAALFQQQGLLPYVGDVTDPGSLTNLPRVSEVLYAVGFDKNAPYSIHDVYCQGMKNVMEQLPQIPRRFIHISSTGVYGQSDGSHVTETTEIAPQRPGAIAAAAAEEMMRLSNLSGQAVSLRLGGIYGPERVPYLQQIKAGQPLALASHGWLNLVHVDDAVNVIELMCRQKPIHDLYLITDGTPVNRQQYLDEIATILGAPKVTFIAADPEDPASQRALGSKRIDTTRFTSEFQFQWNYPGYHEGLAAILTSDPSGKIDIP